jgi:uncharacterized protein YqhQ
VATVAAEGPRIAGLSFEVIKWAGRNRRHRRVQNHVARGCSCRPLTTREPDLDQLVVAIPAPDSVLSVETPGELSVANLAGTEVVI